MDTAQVHQTKCFQNITAWTQTKSENEMHAYWYNVDTKLDINAFDVGCWEKKVTIEISPVGSDTDPHLS